MSMLSHLLRHFLGRVFPGVLVESRNLAGSPEGFNDQGIALASAGRYDEALNAFDRALELRPDYPPALINRGNALEDLRRPDAALASYDRALSIMPENAGVNINRGNALSALGDHRGALESYDRAIALDAASAGAFYCRGEALLELGRFDEAADSFGRALVLDPALENLLGMWLHARLMVCDWNGIEENFSLLTDRIAQSEPVCPPFPLVAIPATPALQRKAAETWARAKCSASTTSSVVANRPTHDRIRVGYFSADFHLHATSHLMAELFELHDRSRFEMTAFSFGPATQDAMRARVSRAFENFFDVREMSDAEVVSAARRCGIDIAIDLKGYCKDSRTGIFAQRVAPVQVNYLGYPGTMGAPFIDYMIADTVIIPEEQRLHYSEKIVYLPESYQPNDTRRPISGREFSKAELGLPQTGFVFCCFNNNFKILPATFGRWMRVLRSVEGSVLWMLEDNTTAADNLRREAQTRGVDPGRLVFAPRMALPEHLARHRAADLFLDTLPCNAHTTASDALWAGLPVLTCPGETFAGRVAASLLKAIRLPELVARSEDDYERLAIEFARSPGRIADLKRKLEANRQVAPLFDIERFTRHLEAGFVAMFERDRAGLPPADIHVVGKPGVS